ANKTVLADRRLRKLRRSWKRPVVVGKRVGGFIRRNMRQVADNFEHFFLIRFVNPSPLLQVEVPWPLQRTSRRRIVAPIARRREPGIPKPRDRSKEAVVVHRDRRRTGIKFRTGVIGAPRGWQTQEEQT